MTHTEWQSLSRRMSAAWPDPPMTPERSNEYFDVLHDLDADDIGRAIETMQAEGWRQMPSPGGIRERLGHAPAPLTAESPTAEPPTGVGQPLPPGVHAARRRSGKAVASLVLGIAGIIIAPIILSTLAIIFGVIARGETGRDPSLAGEGMALAGVVLGVIGLIGGVVVLILLSSI